MPKPTQSSRRVLGNKNCDFSRILLQISVSNQCPPFLANTINATLSNKKAREKNVEKANNDLEKLDTLHKRTGVTRSLRIPDDRRIKLKPRAEPGASLLDFDFSENKVAKKENESSQEMPDADSFLRDLQSTRAEETREDSEFSEDSELNAIMQNMDTENPSDANRRLGRGSDRKAKTDESNLEKQRKRKEASSEGQSDITRTNEINKKPKIVDEDNHPDVKSLFLKNRASSEPSADPEFCDDPILSEADFAPDSTLFDIIPSRSLDSRPETAYFPDKVGISETHSNVEPIAQQFKLPHEAVAQSLR